MTDRELTQEAIRDNQLDFDAILHRYSGMVFSKALDVMHTEEGSAFNILNEEHNRQTVSLEDLPVSVLDALVYEPTDFEMREARFKQLDVAIATLTKLDQQLLYLKYYEDMDFDDIARCTGLTKNNVHVRLYRIGVRLKAILIHGKKFRHQPRRLIHDMQECYEAAG